jgi:hypothetical protein
LREDLYGTSRFAVSFSILASTVLYDGDGQGNTTSKWKKS